MSDQNAKVEPMNPNRYQKLAMKTQCPQGKPVAARLIDRPIVDGCMIEIDSFSHAAVGIAGEAGELASIVEKYVWYRKDFDRQNAIEELGDLLWYIAEACDAIDTNMEAVMRANIAKLKKRFPERFSYETVAEEDRDRAAESDAMIKAMDDGVNYETDNLGKDQ